MQVGLVLRRAAPAALLLAAGAASAHTGHDHAVGFAAGLAHPFSGLDHLLAFVTVGLWSAAAMPAGRRWVAPALFVGAMGLGALLAQAGLALPVDGLETLIALSVIALGALLALGERVAPAAGLALTAAAALLHGGAHGLEMASDASFTAYAAGFGLATAGLHVVGLGAGEALARLRAASLRALGAAVGLAGVALVVARF